MYLGKLVAKSKSDDQAVKILSICKQASHYAAQSVFMFV